MRRSDKRKIDNSVAKSFLFSLVALDMPVCWTVVLCLYAAVAAP